MSVDAGKDAPYVPLAWEEEETGMEKFWRRMKEDPLVPIGSLLTVGALTYASLQLRSGNRAAFQHALRWRVGFQTVTVAAAAASLFWVKPRTSPIPPPNADGSPARVPYWNKEKEERVAAQNDAEWHQRFSDAHTRTQKEEEAVQRMVQAEIQQREQHAAATAPPPPEEPRAPPRIGQDKRRFTFQQ